MLYGVVALAIVAGLPANAEPPTQARPDRYLLSVGINEYPNLSTAYHLYGAINDTERITDTLKPLGFGYVKVLKGKEATRDAIRARWKEVVAELGKRLKDAPPAWVVFHFSGHGSRVPDQPPGHPDHDEKDGWDETLVPVDAKPDDPDSDIRDDELFHFIEDVTRNGRAKIFVLLDCCHSGSGARGEMPFRIYRREKLDRAQAAAPVSGAIFDEHTLPSGSVVLSACKASDLEPEYPDYSGPGKKVFGLMSFFFTKLLADEPFRSRISNGTLRDSIWQRYLEDRGVSSAPTPQVEASPEEMLKETILGLGPEVDGKPYAIVDLEDGGLGKMQAGILHDVTKGSVYRVYRKPEDAEAARGSGAAGVAWLVVEEVNGPISGVRSVAGPGSKTDNVEWPKGMVRGYAVESIHMPGDFLLRVKVVRAERCEQADWADSAPLAVADIPSRIARAFEKPADPAADGVRSIEDRKEPWLRLVTGANEAADLLVRFSGDHAALFPVTGLAREQAGGPGRGVAPACLRGGYGPIDLRSQEASETLRDYLRRIVRSRNLSELVASRAGRELKVDIKMMRVLRQDRGTPTEMEPWPREARTGEYRPMRAGELYVLQLHNAGDRAAYVTAAVVQPDQRIDVMFPRQRGGRGFDENALPGHATLVSTIFRSTPPFGNRTVAYLITDEPHNFTLVGQAALPIAKGGGADDMLLPQQKGAANNSSPGGGTLGQVLLSELGFRDEPVGIPVADPSWGSGFLRWLSVEGDPDSDKDKKMP
jgi:hypothetical protein